MISAPEPHQYQASYKINGLFLGHTSFKVVTNANLFKGIQYSSNTFPIQVNFSYIHKSYNILVIF